MRLPIIITLFFFAICIGTDPSHAQTAAEKAAHLKELIQKAESGDPQAQVDLGKVYQDGDGVTQNVSEAMKWYIKAAEKKFPMALSRLGCQPDASDALIKSSAESLIKLSAEYDAKKKELWPKYHKLTQEEASQLKSALILAEKGDVKAQIKAGDFLRVLMLQPFEFAIVDCFGPCGEPPKPNYSDITRDNVEALKWYRKAAESGDSEAQIKMGDFSAEQAYVRTYSGYAWSDMLVHEEFNIQDNNAEALKWYRKAADQGDANAMETIAWAYSRGEIVPRDKSETVKWWKQAAHHGDRDIQCYLGDLYSRDNSGYADIKFSNEETYFWLKICNPVTDEEWHNKKLLKQATDALTAQEKDKINIRLENWQKNRPQQSWRDPMNKRDKP